MCQYCGCRDMPLLRDYIAEHERAINHGGAAVRALDCGAHEQARELLAAMADELRSHWRGEENGLAIICDALEEAGEPALNQSSGPDPNRKWRPETCSGRMRT